ncbi:MAG: methionine--tRNA ligase [Promethearchaeia archaeon]
MEIDYSYFKKLDLKVGLVISCEKIPKSRNLYKFLIDCGELEPRQIISGISRFYKPENLIGHKIIILANLKPRKIMGLESNGIILAVDINNEPFLIKIDEYKENIIPPGVKIR